MTANFSLCVFCGSSFGNDPSHIEFARELGRMMAANDITLVFGGGRIGLMGVLADAALIGGGAVTGVIPDFLSRAELVHPNVSNIIQVDSMHARKQKMFELADAFAVLPGGIGTLDEAIEVITWKQLKLHAKPILLADHNAYWRRFRTLLGDIIDSGFAAPDLLELVTPVTTPRALITALQNHAPDPGTAAADRL